MIQLTLPYPPSVNTYWRHVGHRILISRAGRDYRKQVYGCVLEQCDREQVPLQGWVHLSLALTFPDRRKRDLDNPLKALFDSLEYAQVLLDDCQIAGLTVERFGPRKPGCVQCTLVPMPDTVTAHYQLGACPV